MTHFSWRAATFSFDNEEFARRVMQLNEPRLMAHSNGDTE
jgi:hypothetical protein